MPCNLSCQLIPTIHTCSLANLAQGLSIPSKIAKKCHEQSLKLAEHLKQMEAAIDHDRETAPLRFWLQYGQKMATSWQLKDSGSPKLTQSEHALISKEPAPATKQIPIGQHQLPPLPYAYDALEPHLSAEIMRLHHDEHHRSYVEGLNRAENTMKEARQTGDFTLIRHWQREAAFHGAGHYLHTLFWQSMSPEGDGQHDTVASGKLLQQIQSDFGSYEAFKQHFSKAAEEVEGSGWAILVWTPRSGRLEILQAEKHQNLSQQDVIPILPLDVWEHAYYLQYPNQRKRYIEAWWNVVNWPAVTKRFASASTLRWTPSA